jgi:hypothetical protein
MWEAETLGHNRPSWNAMSAGCQTERRISTGDVYCGLPAAGELGVGLLGNVSGL